MRKLITLVLFVYTISSYPSGESLFPKIDLTCHEAYTADGMSHLRPRTPARIPVVYQNGYCILFESQGCCESVAIVELDNEDVVYEVPVSEDETQVMLPIYLEGVYEIRLYRGNRYYSGTIQLTGSE